MDPLRFDVAVVGPGVAEVASVGGFVRQWQVEVSALKLRQYDVMLGEVMDAVAQGNQNVGGRTIEENGAEFIVRGIGLVESAAEPGGIGEPGTVSVQPAIANAIHAATGHRIVALPRMRVAPWPTLLDFLAERLRARPIIGIRVIPASITCSTIGRFPRAA